MLAHTINIRVRYSETDQMKYVYYGNYAQYFELGRAEWLRNLGTSYKSMEDSGIMLPVIDLHIKYYKPALYDDLLTLTNKVTALPSAKITFEHQVFNEQKELLTTGESTLVFFDIKKNKPTRVPQYILDLMKPYFKDSK